MLGRPCLKNKQQGEIGNAKMSRIPPSWIMRPGDHGNSLHEEVDVFDASRFWGFNVSPVTIVQLVVVAIVLAILFLTSIGSKPS
jgi:hypothetical protein